MKRVLVVAHPDDETIWFGGLLIACPGDWTVICCSIPRRDPERADKFVDACRALGATSWTVATREEPAIAAPMDYLADLPELARLGDFGVVVTHNAVGEYGHAHHVSVNRFIAARWPEKMITGGYGKAPEPHIVALTQEQFGRKVAALRCYDHVSPSDGEPKWQALVKRYGPQFDLAMETYTRPC